MKGFTFFLAFAGFFLGLGGFFVFESGSNPVVMSMVGFYGAALWICLLLTVRKTTSHFSWFSASSIFFTAFFIAFFWFGALYFFIPEIQEHSAIWMNGSKGTRSMMVVLIGYSGLILGYLMAIFRRKQFAAGKAKFVLSEKNTRLLIWLFTAASGLAYLVFLSLVGPSFYAGAYDGTKNWGDNASYFHLLFNLFMYIAISLSVYRLRASRSKVSIIEYILSFNFFLLLLIGFSTLAWIYVGDRGPVINMFLVLVGCYSVFFVRIKLIYFLIAVALGVFILDAMTFFRTRDATASIEDRIQTGVDRLGEREWYLKPSDLAGCIRHVNAGMIYYDRLFYGNTMIVELSTLVPFAPGYVMRNNISYKSSVHFTMLLSPIGRQGNQTGAGTSFFADIYINFHLVGVIFISLLFGYGFGYAEMYCLRYRTVFGTYIYVILLSNSIYWARDSLLGTLREIAWGLVILYIVVLIFGFKRMIFDTPEAKQIR